MLSILIPIFNYDIRDLIVDIQTQSKKANVPFEIIVLDDASDEAYRAKNRRIVGIPGVVYHEEPLNLGRSKVRNKLGQLAKFDNLLFMDCDSGIVRNDYIETYLEHMDNYDVIYGGRLYAEKKNAPVNYRLHWLYGVKREQSTANNRNHAPNRSFQTNNFLIRKSILTTIGFNEEITGYGHEDTLFGYELKMREIAIMHIDNPVVHLGLEENEEFLRKTRDGIKNLRRIMQIKEDERKLIKDITILSYYKKIEKLRLDRPLEYLYKRYEHILRRNLLGQKPRLMLLDIYKLGYLCSLHNDN